MMIPGFHKTTLLRLVFPLLLASTGQGATVIWQGSISSNWENPTNWIGSALPGANDDVFIDGGTAQPTLNFTASGTTPSVTIQSLTIGQTTASTLTFQNGNVTDRKLVVTGDVIIGPTGTLTHAANAGSETHRLGLDVGNNLTIAAGGQINVVGMGYAAGNGPGTPTTGSDNRGGGAYGGQGGIYGTSRSSTYGSITNPVNNGSGGYPASGSTAGGGCVVLRVTGAFTHNGIINANGLDCTTGNKRGPGSGGSINMTASSITGSGVMTADGGVNGEGTGHGGGGRIAVKLTGGGTVPDSILTNITACTPLPDACSGAAGTVYIQDGARTNLIVNQKNRTSMAQATAYTLLMNDTNQFAAIIVTNRALLMVGTNAQLNLTGCTLLTPPSTMATTNITSRLIVATDQGGTLNWTGTWTNNGCISLKGTNLLAVSGGMTVVSNAILTHEPGFANAIKLSLAGDLTLDVGSVVWTKGRSDYSIGSPSGYVGGSHGGVGEMSDAANLNQMPTYGSITNPVTPGGASLYSGAGGGVVIIRATGVVTVNGRINVDGDILLMGSALAGRGGGAGGSVNIVAAGLRGNGSVSAAGSTGSRDNNWGGYGGGGRIAVVLTNSMNFTNVSFSAVGGGSPGNAYADSGAGTIYLKGTNQAYGLLIVSNNTSAASESTLITPQVTDAVVGDVQLRGTVNTRLTVSNDCTLTVYGSWSNGVATNAFSGGTVVLAGASPATVWGGNTWSNLVITNRSKVVFFQTNTVQTITGTPTFDNYVTLRSTVDGAQWMISKVSTGLQTVGKVSVKDSRAVSDSFKATGGSDLGNTRNWIFPARGTVVVVQ